MRSYKNTVMMNYRTFISFTFVFITLSIGNELLGQAPYISNLDKTSGKIGETITITGSNFSNNSSNLQVNFGSVKAIITTASSNLLEVLVPAGATFDKISVTNTSTRLTGYSNELFNISFGGAKNNINSFETQVTFPTGTNTYDLCFCDFDNDGLSDIAISNNGSNEIILYKNNSTTTTLSLSKVTDTDLNIGFPSININCADLNEDGKAELIATQGGSSNNGVFVFKNESSGTGNFSFSRIGSNSALPDFTLPNDSEGNIRTARRVEINDLDLDGKPEIIISSSSGNILDIFQNTSASGNVSFNTTPIQTTVTGLTISSGLDVKDLNNDGLPEIALVDDKNSNIYIVNNQSEPGNLNFGETVEIAVSGGFQNLKIGDINKDGFNDMVITDRINSRISVLKNETSTVGGSISMSSAATISSGINQPWGLDLGDLDGDGNIDVAISSTNTSGSNIQILLGDDPASFSFLGTTTLSTTSNSRNIKIGDLNGDGKPDVGLTHKVSGVGDLSVFINRNCVIPEVLPIGSTEICTGQTLILKGTMSGGATYTWDQDADKDDVYENLSIKIGSDNTIDASANGSGNYRLTISDGLGCSEVSNIVDVTVTSSGITAPVASSVPAASTINCEGVDIQLSATSDASITSYEWTGPNNYTSTDQNPLLPAVTADMTGKYTVLGRNADGCISETAELLIVVESLPVIAVNNNGLDTFCIGSSATVSVTDFGSGYSYKWEKSGVEITGQTTTTLNITESGDYTAIITSISNGCSHESLPRTLSAIPVPTNSITSQDLVCEDLPLALVAPSADQNGFAVSHAWDFGDGNTTSGAEVSNIYDIPGTYTVSLTTTYNEITTCTSTVLTKDIVVQGVPNTANGSTISINTSSGSNDKCPSESIDLSITGEFSNYSWFRDIGAELSNTSSLMEITEPGRGDDPVTYFLSATDEAGCNFSADIEISLKDNAGITLSTLSQTSVNPVSGETEIILEADQLSIGLSVEGATGGISWTPEEIFDDPMAANVSAIPNDVNFLIKVSGIDAASCLESDSIRVINNLVRPKRVFSPNGDGIGDECWEITNARSLLDGCTIFIFDSKGQVIKQEQIVNQSDDCVWDGTRNGLSLPEGVYYYALKCVDNINVPTDLSGSILLGR